MKLVGLAETEEEDVVFTPWSLTHVAAGYVARASGVGIWEWNLFHAAYESKDVLMHQEVKNSFVNSCGDQVCANVSYFIPLRVGVVPSLTALALCVAVFGAHDHIG